MSGPPDAAARARALDLAGSFIVQAPAGSGKTTLLAQRYLRLLAHVDRPEEILALTFTRKAAGEMRARVLDALDLARRPAPDARSHLHTSWTLGRDVLARDETLGWGIEAQPSRLRIMTIDALCAQLARQLPWLSGAGGELRVAERPDDLYLDAARQTLAGIVDPAQAAPVERLLQQLDNRLDKAGRLLADMLARRDHWLRRVVGNAAREALEAGIANLVREHLEALRACVPATAADELVALADAAASRLPAGVDSPLAACAGLDALPADVGAWQGIAWLLLTGRGEWRRRVDVSLGFPRHAQRDKQRFYDLVSSLAVHPELKVRLDESRRLPPPRYSDAQWAVLAALLELLPLAAGALMLVFRERGEADFIARAQAALDALGQPEAPTDLALALDYRIRHILVDEFQDTSVTQFTLLERLTAGWQDGDGRTLFLVGDPVQSIYRFREAEVGLFLAAIRDGIGSVPLIPLRLGTNFRAQRQLVEWVNRVFAPMLPAVDEPASGAVAYGRGDAWHAALPGEAVVAHASTDAADEARTVVELIQGARREDPSQHIAVLVRGRAHLAGIAPRLNAAGLRFQAVDIEPLASRPAIGDLLALTRALAHFADRTAWLAVLRAPWCGLALADLHALVAGAPGRTVWDCVLEPAADLSEDGSRRLDRLRRILEVELAERGRLELCDWVEHAWIALGGPATLVDAADLANARAYFDRLRSMREREADRLGAALEDLFAAPDPAAGETLQLMTIHKAKGLEFDTVILPGLDRITRANEKPLLHWLEIPRAGSRTDLLLAPIGLLGGEADPLHGWLGSLMAQRDALESRRVLYVAVTRARRRLHLLGQLKPGHGTREPRAGSFLHALWPAMSAQFVADLEKSRPPGRESARRAPARGIRRLIDGWQPPAPAPAVPRGPVLRESASDLRAPPYDWAGEPARRIGIVLHRALQRIAEEGLDLWGEDRIAAAVPVLEGELRAAGLAPRLVPGATARTVQALRRTLADTRGRWILEQRPGARCELAVTGRYAGQLIDAVIDRSFVDEDGVRWIIDYKSSRHEGGALAAFLDRELARYAAQLAAYTGLMGRLEAGPVRAGLYFPMLSQWREWQPPPGGAGNTMPPGSR